VVHEEDHSALVGLPHWARRARRARRARGGGGKQCRVVCAPALVLIATTIQFLTSQGGHPSLMSLSLPLEVIEETIQYLYDDMPTLRACALVHSSWTPACRAHLFYTVRVARPAKLLASEQPTTDTNCRTKLHVLVSHIAQLRALVDLLESGPHLRPLIRHLHWALDRSDQLPREVVSTLFPRVRLFRLEGRHLHWPMVASLPALEELELGVVSELTGSIPSDPLPLQALTIPGVVRVGISRAELWPALAGLVRADTLKVLKLPPEPMFRLFESPTSWLMGFVSTLRALDELWIDFGTFWMMTRGRHAPGRYGSSRSSRTPQIIRCQWAPFRSICYTSVSNIAASSIRLSDSSAIPHSLRCGASLYTCTAKANPVVSPSRNASSSARYKASSLWRNALYPPHWLTGWKASCSRCQTSGGSWAHAVFSGCSARRTGRRSCGWSRTTWSSWTEGRGQHVGHVQRVLCAAQSTV
jgi:hypothetical protein